MSIKGYIEIFGEVKAETDLAILADVGEKNDVWLPKSQLEDWPDVNKSGEIMMTEWIAEEKGLI